MTTTLLARLRRTPKLVLVGLIAAAVVAAMLVGSIVKPQLRTWLMDGDYRRIHLPADHFLLADASTVKVAGVDAGVVDEVERAGDGTAIVTVKVEDEVLDSVGTRPSAAIRPNTLLGGKYYIDIKPGGERGHWADEIPLERTRLPVELDDVAQTLQPDALRGAAATLKQLDKTLGAGGTEAVQELLAETRDTMRPAARVLDASRGSSARTDLSHLVTGLDTTAGVLTRQEGRLAEILTDLHDTTSALAANSPALAAAIDRMPSALDSTKAAMADLRTSLAKVRETAGPARDSVVELGAFLRKADPVLARAVPVVGDLRKAMRDTRPMVDDLVPVSVRGTEVLDRVAGPVLKRVNGPIADAVLTPYQGTGPYQHTKGDQPFYRELGYMFSGLNATGAYVDKNGHAVAFQPGGGLGTVSGIGPLSLEDMFQHLVQGKETP